MKSYNKVFGGISTHVLYVVAIPLFFFLFMLLYEPFNANEYLSCGRDLFSFNVTMLFAIMLVLMGISRTVLWLLGRKKDISLPFYGAWCAGELFIMSFFMALFTWLIRGREIPYFSVLGKCFEMSFLVSIYPYLIITLLLLIKTNLLKSYASTDSELFSDNSLIRFTDAGQRLKLAIAPASVVYVEAEENYVRIHYVDGEHMKEYVLRNSMKAVEELSERFGLIRSHRSYIVNPAHVKILRKDKEGVIMADFDVQAEPVPVSKKYYDRLVSLLG